MHFADVPRYVYFFGAHIYAMLALVIFALPHRDTKAAKHCYYIALTSAILMACTMFLAFLG